MHVHRPLSPPSLLAQSSGWTTTLGNAAALGGGVGGGFAQFERLCVSVSWGASPSFEDDLLRELRAGSRQLPRQQMLERLVIFVFFLLRSPPNDD